MVADDHRGETARRPAPGIGVPGPGKIEPAVTVTGAEERYLDETKYRSPLNGVRVALLTGVTAKELELRFETPNGAGSSGRR